MRKWNKVTVALLTAIVMAATSVPGTAFAANTSQNLTSQSTSEQAEVASQNTSEKAEAASQNTSEKAEATQETASQDQSSSAQVGAEEDKKEATPASEQGEEKSDTSDKKEEDVQTASDDEEDVEGDAEPGIYVETDKGISCVYSVDGSLKTSTVSGISYNEYKNEITLKGYKGGAIAIIGLDDVDINVASASTITLKGNDDWLDWEDENVTCLYSDCENTCIKGSSKLTIKGKKYYQYDEIFNEWNSFYPEGIVCQSLELVNANIYISGVYNGLKGSDVDMYGGTLTISKAIYTAVRLNSELEINGGKISGGYSLQQIDNDYYILGKDGVYLNDDFDFKPASKNAKTVTITGGTAFSSDEDDSYEWTLNKGVLTIKGEDGLGVGPYYDDMSEYGWDNYGKLVTSVVLGDGITAIDMSAFSCCRNIKSVSLPASLEEFKPFEAVTEDGNSFFSAFKEVKVNSKNKYFTSISGVLFSKDKKTLLYYPGGRVAKSYTIPNGTTTIGAYTLYFAPITTLVLPKSLVKIEAYDEGSRNVFDENIKNIKVTKGNSKFKVSNNMLLTTDGKDLLWYAPETKNTIVHIPNGVEKIYADFELAANTRCIYVPDSVNTVYSGTFNRDEDENCLDVFFAGNAPKVIIDEIDDGDEDDESSESDESASSESSNDAGLEYLACGLTTVICDGSKEGWSAVIGKELFYNLVATDDPDSYYPSKLWFDADEDGEVYVGDEESGSVSLAYESDDANIKNLVVSSSNSNGLEVSYDGDGTITYEGLLIGNYTIQAAAMNGVKATYKVKVTTEFEEDEAALVVGEKYTNTLPGIGKTKVTYTSSNSKIASVDKNGKVTAKKAGDCTITAKFLGEVRSYDLTVENDYPGNQNIYLSDYNYNGNYFVLTVENEGVNNFIVNTKGAFTEDCDDDEWNRAIKSKGTITVKPGEEKDIKLYVLGSKLDYYDEDDGEWYAYEYEDASLYFNFTYCGETYLAEADSEGCEFFDEDASEWIEFGVADEDED